MSNNGDPMVALILNLKQKKRLGVLAQIEQLQYEPIQNRFHPLLFSVLPDNIGSTDYNSLRQAYRLVAPLMAIYPETTDIGSFGTALGQLGQHVSKSMIEESLLIFRQFPRLYQADSILLRMVILMKNHHILINWEQMVPDVRYWNDRIWQQWMQDFIVIQSDKEVQ